MSSRIDEAGHTKAFNYPVREHWGESRKVQFRRWDLNRQHISPFKGNILLSINGVKLYFLDTRPLVNVLVPIFSSTGCII